SSNSMAMDLSVDEIRQIQIVLKEKGFYTGPIDGQLGAHTKQALITFQRRQGFQANGAIDQQTVTALDVSVRGMQGGAQGTTGQGGAQTTTGQGGTQQQPNRAGSQPSTSGQGTTHQPSANQGTTQQPSANPPAASGGQRSQSGSQPSTSGQGSSQRPSANEN